MEHKIDKCRSCGAEIIWIKTPSGKNTPVDRKARHIWIYDPETNSWKTGYGHESHFATCPDAKKWRKKNG